MSANVSTIREALAPVLDALSAHRILRWGGKRGNSRAGRVVGRAQEVVVLLPSRVRANNRESGARGGAAVAGSRRQHEHIAGADLERLALRAAELDRRGARDHGEDLVRGRVEVVEVEHAVDPRS